MMGKVIPPGNLSRVTGMHWLARGGEYPATIALQWNPGSETWTHSNAHATALDKGIDTTGWRYVAPIPMPELGK